MDGKKWRLGVGALGISASLLVSIALNEGYRGEAYKDAVGVPNEKMFPNIFIDCYKIKKARKTGFSIEKME